MFVVTTVIVGSVMVWRFCGVVGFSGGILWHVLIGLNMVLLSIDCSESHSMLWL